MTTRSVWLFGDRLDLHLTGEDTAGSLCVVVDHPSPGFELMPHLHRNEDETIHIVEGTFELLLGEETRELGPGNTVHVPRGTVHGIRNTGTTAGRRVLVFHPAGVEGLFLAAGTADKDEAVDPAKLRSLFQSYGWEVVDSSRGTGNQAR